MVRRLLLSVITSSLIATTSGFDPHADSQAPLLQPQQPPGPPAISEDEYEFTLRHIFHHGTYENPLLHKRLDVNSDDTLWVTSDDGLTISVPPPRLRASSQPVKIQRLVDRRVNVMEGHLAAARHFGVASTLSPESWVIDEIPGPNVSDKDTVLNLAKMAANAYIMTPGTEKWVDVSGPFNHSQNYGWDNDGLRGHIYANARNTSIVISIKGTSTALFDGEETTTNDKVNDNLFFSCCCAQGGNYFWRQVCDCYTTTYTCNSTCLVGALKAENRYYRASLDLYANVTAMYPNANVWLVGHSLGGAVSSMLGLTYGLPAVTFEAVPEALPASRLGLPVPPGSDPNVPQKRDYTGAYHFGHTADPVFMGTCNGATSICTLGGYALESLCHTGQRCVYDTVEDLGWRVGIGTHRILSVISDVIERYDTVPSCKAEKDCLDCINWKFFESNGSDPITSSTIATSSSTPTRTSTCKTPGWWGCLDKTTTVMSTSTSTCQTPGWFGCNDPTTTTTSTVLISSATPSEPPITSSPPLPTSSTTTCKHPGWFGGCNDPTLTASSSTPATVTTSVCETPGFFWGCWDDPPHRATPQPTSTVPTATHTCRKPGFFWGCWDPAALQVPATSASAVPTA
ncbi:hypothetical protein VTO42DRAFT_5071 [Malbranchea cinnamomea]